MGPMGPQMLKHLVWEGAKDIVYFGMTQKYIGFVRDHFRIRALWALSSPIG
jgi:hypothetical protein